MDATRRFLSRLGLPARDAYDLPSSPKRFPDGAHYRIEIPSVEGPRSFETVLETCDKLQVPLHRISQGSGIMLLTETEIREMASLGRSAHIEVSLFVGPRAGWDISALPLAAAGKAVASRLEGADQLVYALEDIKRACRLGIRGVLVADEGLLWVTNEMKKAGELPRDLVIKVSVVMGHGNPASIRLIEQMGANTYNVPTDLSLPRLAAIRQAIDIPLDIYIESPDDFGGFIRHYEVAEIIRVAAPVYIKFGLRNAPNIYPSGLHLEPTSIALSRERVRRARLAVELLHEYGGDLSMSKPGAADLGLPAAV